MELNSKERQKIYDRWHKDLGEIKNDSLGMLRSLHKKALKHLDLNKDSKLKLLDLACGKGLFLKELELSNYKLDLYGVDISKVAIDKAKNIVNANLQQADGENLPFENNSFDRIICLGGLEYFQDPVRGASEASRVLKKDGIAVFFVPNLMFLGYIWLAFKFGIMPTHGGSDNSGKKVYYDYNNEKFFTRKGWVDILQKGNLSVIGSYTYTNIELTKFANPLILWFYNKFLYRIIPFNLSYSFVFVCKKSA